MGARFNWIFHFGQPPRYARNVRVIQLAKIGANRHLISVESGR
jgi:hypothetical protein